MTGPATLAQRSGRLVIWNPRYWQRIACKKR
jgi:hypothetical protein